MGDYTDYSYICYLKKTTPEKIIDILEQCFMGKVQIEGSLEFLNEINIAHFDREKLFLVIYGSSKYNGNKKSRHHFYAWISEHVNDFYSHNYRGYDEYCSAFGGEPILIYRDEPVDFKKMIELHEKWSGL